MSRPLAAAQPNVIAAAPVRYAQTNADVTTPRLNPIPIPFAGPFPAFGTPPPAPYPAAFYPMGPPSAFPPFMPPGTFPGPRVDLHPPPPPGVVGPYPGTFPGPSVDLHPPPPPGVLGPYPGTPSLPTVDPRVDLHPPPPGVVGPYPGTPSLPTVDPRYITQYPVCPGPPGFPPSLIYPPPGVFSHQGPALIHGIVDPVTMARPPVPPAATMARPPVPPAATIARPPAPPAATMARPPVPPPATMAIPPVPPVAPVDTPQFKIYIGKIAATVDNDFVLSLLQVCGVVKSWEPVINPIDGISTGFGFCEFESAEGSLRAMRLLNKLSVDGQELVLNVNQATRDYFKKYSESTPEEKAKEAETETRDGVVSLADNGKDLSRAILDVTKRGAAVMQRIRSLIEGETKRCQNSTDDADKDVMQRIHSLIEERMKSKLPGSPTPAVQAPACIVDVNGDDDTGSGALEEMKIRRQCEQKEHLGEMKAVGSEGEKDREMTAAGISSLQIGEAPSMRVPMNCESTVEHEKKSQHRERGWFCKRSGKEKGRQKKAVGSEGRKDREVTATEKSSLQIDGAPSMLVRMESESTVEHDRKSQLRGRDGFTKRNGEERCIVFVPGLVSDKQNIGAGEKVGSELRATSHSGEKTTLDAKQLLATVPKTKEQLFAHDVNWAIYDEYGLHERMRPWISKKATEVFGEELAEFVDYVVATIKEHVSAPRMLELLESLLDDGAEKFVLLMWRKLIFEIKRVEEGLA